MWGILRASAIAAALLGASGARADDAFVVKQIIATGESLPGGGKISHLVSWPVINDRGDVAFVAHCDDPRKKFATMQGAWVREAGGKMRATVTSGTSLGGKETVEGLAAVVLSNDGWLAAKVSMKGGAGDRKDPTGWGMILGAIDAVVRVDPAGKLTVVAKAQGAAPGITGGTHATLGDVPTITTQGRMIFSGGVQAGGKGSGKAIWRVEPDGAIALVARQGMATGTAGDQFGMLTLNDVGMSDDGGTVFQGELQVAAKEGERPPTAVWRVSGKSKIETVLQSRFGLALPGDDDAKKGQIRAIKGIAINDAGAIAVAVEMRNGPADAAVIAIDAAGKPRTLVSTTTPAPGGAGMKFMSFERLAMNSRGKVAFSAWTYAGVNGGPRICAEDAGERVRSIAGAGEIAPGAGTRKFRFLGAPQFCATGQIAFAATLDDNKRGVWMTDASGTLRLVGLQGEKLPGIAGREVAEIAIASIGDSGQSGGADGRPRALSNSGTLTFHIRFADGTAAVFTGTFGGGSVK